MTIIWPEHGLKKRHEPPTIGWTCRACNGWVPWFLKRHPGCKGKIL